MSGTRFSAIAMFASASPPSRPSEDLICRLARAYEGPGAQRGYRGLLVSAGSGCRRGDLNPPRPGH
jgi:hypothetical protein